MGKHEAEIATDAEKESVPPTYPHRVSTSSQGRKGSVVDAEILQHGIFDERYEKTQRGLKSRHAQMIALGGTIGN